MREHHVQCLLMGGQACVFYGAAEFSRDTDLAILADDPNLAHLISRDEPTLTTALDEEEQKERLKDKDYWQPLKRELNWKRCVWDTDLPCEISRVGRTAILAVSEFGLPA